jgi:VanZ family protein
MIKTLDRFLKSRCFFWLRISQFILALCIFTSAALLPGDKLPEISSDHTLHFFGNALLFLSASVAFMGRTKLGILILLLVPYSLLIEMGQSLSPGRQVDIHDVWANIAGLAAGYLIAHLCEWVWRKISNNRNSSF